MDYYIEGDAAKADQIKAAFESRGYDVWRWKFNSTDGLYFSNQFNNKISYSENKVFCNLIKTHPDYQELKLPIEPKFKVGDWLVYNDGNTFCLGRKEVQIQAVEKHTYIFNQGGSGFHNFIDSNCRLWTIADAKDGDVLATGNIICIFKKLDKDGYYIISPCIYTVKDGLEIIDNEDDTIGSCGFKPATKEDRELLFRKMKEAGYTWDEKKKELHKIKHYAIAYF